MRHQLSGKKLNRSSSHRQALLNNLAIQLFQHEQIRTTLPKAKALRPVAEKLITWAKKGAQGPVAYVNARRHLAKVLRSTEETQKKLMSVLAPRYSARQGGYTRIIKDGFAQGNNAPMAIIQLVEETTASKEA